MELYTNSAEETRKIGFEIGKKAKGGLYCLYGELGAGKTTFAQGFAKGLGITARIVSPTFIIMRSHGKFHHVDLYRIRSIRDVQAIGLEEVLEDLSNVVLIEWAEKIEKHLPKKRTDIRIYYEDFDKRKIVLEEKG